MAANLTRTQVDITGSIVTEYGQSIIGAHFGDHAILEYNQYLTINPPQSVKAKAKDPVKNRFYGVPAKNNSFVNRPSILAEMEAALSSPSQGCRIVALKGLGGMGKTQLMLQYCYLHRTDYEFVFWLEVDSMSAAVDSFRNLAINLGLDEATAKGKYPEKKIIEWVCLWLQTKTKWLLLLNNVDDTTFRDLYKLLPRIGGNIILTTRESVSLGIIVIYVDKMQEREAIFLLLGDSSIDSKNERGKTYDAREIIAELDFMPLAIDQARAYCDSMMISFRDYLRMLKNKKERPDLFRYSNRDNLNDYKYTVTTVWQLSLERIRSKSPIAVQILKACTFLHPEKIPVQLFKKQFSVLGLLPPSFVPPTSKSNNKQPQNAIREAIAILVKFSFVSRTCPGSEDSDENPADDLLTIHRLVQKVVYDAMDNRQRLRWAHKIATALNSEINTNCTQNIMDIYTSHTRHFVKTLDLSEKPLESRDLNNLLIQELDYFMNHGIYFGMDEFAQLSIRISEAVYGSEHCETAKSLYIQGRLYYSQAKYSEAEPLYKRALAIREKKLKSDHPDIASCLNNLANLFNVQGKHERAEPLYKRALAIREKTFGPEHQDTATSLNNLALFYEDQHKYDDAEPLYKRALAIREKTLTIEHLDTATSLDNLASFYENLGKYDKAEPYKRALEIRATALGKDRPETAQSLNNLASLYYNRGEYSKAEPLYKQALAIRSKALGLEHPETAQSLNDLAELYKIQSKYDEAEPLHKQALAIREKALGPEHSETASSLNNLASLYNDWGKYEEAEPLYKRAQAIYEKALGERSNLAISLNNLANVYYGQKRYDKAEPLYEQALEIREKELGSEHPDTGTSLANLAILYIVQEKFDEAERLHKRALVIREKVLGAEHLDTAQSLNCLACLYYRQGKYDEAEALYKRALAIREKKLGSKHPSTLSSRKI